MSARSGPVPDEAVKSGTVRLGGLLYFGCSYVEWNCVGMVWVWSGLVWSGPTGI
jgi:hypothetical protein